MSGVRKQYGGMEKQVPTLSSEIVDAALSKFIASSMADGDSLLNMMT